MCNSILQMECVERERQIEREKRERDGSLKAKFNTSLISTHVLCMSATVLITYKTTYIYTAALHTLSVAKPESIES